MSATAPRPPGDAPPRVRVLPIALALILLFLVLLLPAHPREFVLEAFLKLPLELPLIVLALLALGASSLSRVFRLVVVAAAGTLLFLRLADQGTQAAFNRPFNPLLELHLLGDGWNLASQSVGRLEAGLAVLAALVAFALVLGLLYRGLGGVARLRGRARRAVAVAAALVLAVGTVVLLVDRRAEERARHRHVQADLGHDIVARFRYLRRSITDLEAFVVELATDPLEEGAPPTFDALAGLDVGIVFVESYGRSFVDDERFRDDARERLATLGEVVDGAGLHARSGWLTSPIRGGRSWLAHATFASGLRVDSQARFDRLLASDRTSLNRLFGAAGWHTAGLMPAIRGAWPEGAWYGFDDTRDLARLGYAGEPFGWVTMPDQYTLAAFETLVREPSAAPVMAEIALISSHAPWTPVTTLVPWDDIGDGSIFDGSHRFGDDPSTIWSERERVRDHYALTLDYTLEVLGGYLERYGSGALFVILGDHQPSAIIDGWGATADVPVHVVTDDPALLERLPAAFFSVGMQPGDELPSLPMEAMRETLARSFSTRVVDGTPAEDGTASGSVADEAATRP